MRYESINRKYTDIISEYIGKGYYFNTGTMSGSQGEIAHTDLTNGKEIIRIIVSGFSNFRECKEGIEILVGRVTEKYIAPNATGRTSKTIWNNKLEVIKSEKFYQIGDEQRNGTRWYGTEDEARAAVKKGQERYAIQKGKAKRVFSEDAKRIVLPFVKRQPKCKSVKLNEIESVYSVVNCSRFNGNVHKEYYIKFRGTTLRIK